MISASALCRLLCLIAMLSGGVVPAQAQTISTPYGELRLGMTKDQLTHMFGANLEEMKDPTGKIYSRRIGDPSARRSFYIFLTTHDVVYSMLSIEWKHGDDRGERYAEGAFERYLKAYVAPNDGRFDKSGDATRKLWKAVDGLTYEILLGCHRTEAMVRISDFRRRLADDNLDEEARDSFSSWDIGYACFF
jgi:hypothetical protein